MSATTRDRDGAVEPGRGSDAAVSAAIAACFNALFGARYNVTLEGGAAEPDYQPATAHQPARLRFRADFPRSALHEAAHWCLAGPARRDQVDFGYWYVPSGRDPQRQAAFQDAEIRPQALESLFCAAVGLRFDVSVDNLDGEPGDVEAFRRRVHAQAVLEQARGLSARAAELRAALQARFGGPRC